MSDVDLAFDLDEEDEDLARRFSASSAPKFVSALLFPGFFPSAIFSLAGLGVSETTVAFVFTVLGADEVPFLRACLRILLSTGTANDLLASVVPVSVTSRRVSL